MNRLEKRTRNDNRAGMARPARLRAIMLAAMSCMATLAPVHAGSNASDRNLSALHSLRIIPKNVVLNGADASQQFVVMGVFMNGFIRDLTAHSRLSLSNPALAGISDSGRIEVNMDGQLVLRANVGDLSTTAEVQIRDSGRHPPSSFARDIGGILTNRGCNSAECHGGVQGMGGFKLSLNGFFPETDYHWIVRGGKYDVLTDEQHEPWSPRVNLEKPEDSLILLKPTRSVPHEGGRRFEVGSIEYQTILDWIREGAPLDKTGEGARKDSRLEIYPKEVILDPTGQQQLVVTIQHADGSREDMTHRVIYESRNTAVAHINDEGVILPAGPGDTWVIVRAAGHLSSVHIQVIPQPETEGTAKSIQDGSSPAEKNLIDKHVFAKLRKLRIEPSGLCTDEEFLRRVCLDVTGTLPPPGRTREFLKDPDPAKRDKLIDILLESPQYVDFWTYRFSDLFRVYFGTQTNMEFLHMYQEWVRHCIAQNKPYDQIARERVAAQGYGGPILHYYHHAVMRPAEQLMLEQIKLFQGLRLECAQCHDHPTEPWSQDQFWGLAAFFGKMTQIRGKPPDNHKTLLLDLPVGLVGLKDRKPMKHPRTQDDVEPTFMDGSHVPGDDRRDLRMKLAQWITSPENPYFARASANRFWAYFFGRGIINPIDDLRPSNPPTHPGLLEALARDFRDNGYDLKHFIRTIVQSHTYQLSVEPTGTNRNDTVNYSRFHPRPLEAPVLLDAISGVTGVNEKFQMYAGGLGHKGPTPPGTRAVDTIPDLCPSHFLDVYGRSNRQALPEYYDETTIQQALHILAGSTYNDKISEAGGRLAHLLAGPATDRGIMEELYLATLCRYPTEREHDELEQLIRKGTSRKTSMESLTWALVSSREFAYNH